MGLFDKKECALCAGKVNMLTQKKLSDGVLCSDCKHKLGCFTGGWKTKSISDVKTHLNLREQNKQKYASFNCSSSAGGRNSTLNVDFNNRCFIIAGDNADYKEGNPQVFEFSKLQDYWIEEGFTTEADSDHDGIPDKYDTFDNRQVQNGAPRQNAFGMNVMNAVNAMNNQMMNIPIAAQPFVRRQGSMSSSIGIKRVSSVKAMISVSDPYISSPIEINIASCISDNDSMALINAYNTAAQVMQLCMQIKPNGTSPMNNMGAAYAQPMGQQPMMQQGYAQQQTAGFNQPMNQGYGQQINQGFGQQMNQGFAQPINQGYGQQTNQGYNQQINQGFAQQPINGVGTFCPNCGANTSGAMFCPNCGTKIG